MAKRKTHKQIFEECMAAIAKGGLFSIQDVAAAIDLSYQTLYNHFPEGTEERRMIDEGIGKMKRRAVVSVRAKLYKSTNPVALIAFYKMICTPEERAALDYKKVEMNANVQESRRIDMEEAKKFIDEWTKKYGERTDDDD